jgi:hypothetical protein
MIRSKTKVWFGWLCSAAAFVAILAFSVQCRRSWSSEYQAQHCENAVEQSCDPEALRQWAIRLLEMETTFQDSHPVHIPCLEKAWKRSPRIEIRGPRWGNSGPGYVWVGWGSGVLGGWGLAIGAEDLPPPPETRGSIRKWQNGIYFWRELQ